MIILDTDIMIDILRQRLPAIEWLDSLENEEIVLPGFVVMEILQGCSNKLEQKQIEKKLMILARLWPSKEICNEAVNTFALFHLSHGLGILDAIIGQTAVALDLPLYTFNQKHYAAIPGIKTVQPYERQKN
ncbi:MAG: type II toxin-antitoxin system VapC family toxin [Candidatus Schekmanbacteria bacterium]|nr:type II toxin-antitoxin system VapC family toxin [Candidatus Schekmanbacteria bacterium]